MCRGGIKASRDKRRGVVVSEASEVFIITLSIKLLNILIIYYYQLYYDVYIFDELRLRLWLVEIESE